MKNITIIDYIYKNLITEENNEEILSLLESRINGNKPIHIYLSLTFITPNHRGVYYLSTIAKILGQYPKAQVHLVLSDPHMYHKDYVKGLGMQGIEPEQFTKKQVDVISRYLKAFGAKEEQINVYTFSEIWQKMMQNKEAHWLITYYNTLSNITVNDVTLANIKTFDRVFQFSIDIFFAVILHKLYPENLDGIDFFLGRFEKKKIYETIRTILYDEGISKIKRPYLFFFKPSSDLILNGRMPEWNMGLEEIRFIIKNTQSEKEDYLNTLDIHKDDFSSFEIFLDGKRKEMSYQECKKIIESENKDHIADVISSVLYQFLQSKKKLVDNSSATSNISLNSKKDILKISQILKTKNMLNIIKLCDGEHTISQISKELKLQISNASKYIHELELMNLIEDKDGKPKLTRKRLVINLDS